MPSLVDLQFLAAAAGAATAHATVAASVPCHDGAAGGATGGVAHVVHLLHGVGDVVYAAIFHLVLGAGMGVGAGGLYLRRYALLRRGGVEARRFVCRGRDRFRQRVVVGRVCGARCGGEAGEEVKLLAAEEAQLQPAEDVIHDRFGVADLLVASPAAGFEAGVGELLAEDLQRHAVLQGDAGGRGE